MTDEATPGWVSSILRSSILWHASRLALVSAYILGGFAKLLDFPGAMAEQQHFGLEPAWLWAAAAVVVELGGSFLVVIGRLVWLGAGGLGVLTFVAMLTADAFWTIEGPGRLMVANTFFEHLGLIAGLVIVSIHSVGRGPSAASADTA